MCGHGTIGFSTAAIEAGLVEVKEPYTYLTLDAPAGLIDVKVRVENKKAVEVTLTNVPSFVDVYKRQDISSLRAISKFRLWRINMGM